MRRPTSTPSLARRRRRELRFALACLAVGIVAVGYVLRGIIEQRGPRIDQVDDRLARLEVCLSIIYIAPGNDRVDAEREANNCPPYVAAPTAKPRPAVTPTPTLSGGPTVRPSTGQRGSVTAPRQSTSAPRTAAPSQARTPTTVWPASTPAATTPAGVVPSLLCGRLGLPLC